MKLSDQLDAHKRVYFSTRARLILVVLVALLPFAALTVYDAVLDRKAALSAARLELQSLARMVSDDVATQFTAASHLLRSLAETSGLRNGDHASCEKFLRGLLVEAKRYNNLLIADRHGDLLCTGRGPKAGVNLADRDYFRHAVATRSFTVGAPIFGRISNLYSVPIAWPVVGSGDVVEQVVIAALDMSWLADRFARSSLLPHMTTILWDRAGTILYQHPVDRQFSARLLQSVQQKDIGSIVETDNEFRERRTFAIATPPPLTELGLTLAFGISSAEVESPIVRQLWQRISILLLTTAAIFVIAWRIAETSLRQPIARLAEASKALRDGNLGARASGPAPLGEIGNLMAEFNQTAAALESQTTTLRRANRALAMLSECKQALVRSDDEQMMLDLICERIVRFGGYSFAWVGYAGDDAPTLVHPVARFGEDGGYLDSVATRPGDDSRGSSPAETAIRDGHPVISDDFAHDPRFAHPSQVAAAPGARPLVALPLVVEKKTIGALVIHASGQQVFHDHEMPLLRELAGDLAYGIETLRSRAARMRAEEETRTLNANLERRVLERTRELEAANHAKSAFLATMSHEIRTPMNGVLGMVEVLMHERLSERQFDLVKTIRDSATALLGIIDDILDFSKIEAGRLDIEQSPVNLEELIEGICSSLLPVAARRGVDMTSFISPVIPQLVLADEVRVRQIIYNLVGNALKFSGDRLDRRGKVDVRVEVVSSQPLRLSFRITDNGIGIAADALPTLFRPFTQVEASTTRRFGGTGLGLAICKRLVDLMDGDIVVSSTPGIGSTFCVTLPFHASPQQSVNALPDLSRIDCVLVESPELDAADLAVYLEHAGARVRFATALEAAASAPFDATTSVVTIRDAGRDESAISLKVRALSVSPGKGHLLLTWGHRRRCRLEALRIVTLDRDALRRSALLTAVLVASGRASPEIINPEHVEQPAAKAVATDTVLDPGAADRLVLVAEDDAINQKVILQQLSLLGYAAEVAGTGEAALQMWRKGSYALILTDLHMPGMDGYALTEAIRNEERDGRRIPILALTANALRGEANRARAVGMDDYLTKPIRLSTLRAAVEQHLSRPTPMINVPMASEHESSGPVDILDVSVLRALVGKESATLTAFLSEYLTSTQSQSAQLRTAAQNGDTAAVGAIVHKLKSASRAIGAAALGDLCAELEDAARAGSAARVFELVPQFDAMYAQLEQQIARELDRSEACE